MQSTSFCDKLLTLLLTFLHFQQNISCDDIQVFFPESVVIDLNEMLSLEISVLEPVASLSLKSNGSAVHLYRSSLFIFAEILDSNHL